MSSYADEIKRNWASDIDTKTQKIPSLKDTEYPAWTIKEGKEFGVLVKYEGKDINEAFSNARIYSREIGTLEEGTTYKSLLLVSDDENIKDIFASLCDSFVSPGENGVQRKTLVDDPVAWWQHWKEMLGNKNIDPRIYDVLGELLVLKILIAKDCDPVWHGPDFSTYDIEVDGGFVEVKSTVSRSKKEITVSNKYQVIPAGETLKLALCLLEPVLDEGFSIDDVVASIRDMEYDVSLINRKLEGLGFEKGRSARSKKFIVHDILCYEVDENFPHLGPECFVNGELPPRISIDTYKVNLDSMPALSWLDEL